MFGILRVLLLGILLYAVFKTVRFIFQLTSANPHRQQGGSQNQRHADSSKEVKNASFNAEDVQDAKFKDLK